MNEPATLEGTAVDGSSFRWFFVAEYRRLCEALYLLTGDAYEAEDLAQEAMTRVLERWDRVRTMDSPTGYAYRIAMNLHRKRLRHLVVVSRKAFAGTTTAEDHSDAVDDRYDIRRALATVTVKEREALILVDWLDMSSDDAGRTLGIAPGTVRVRLARARQKLRDELGGSDDG
jgi:RNA polymerase sigma factor (sigma-70 family)